MKRSRYTLRFLTPCFCTGENSLKAEIRVPSLRGELRWWFRAVGGTKEQEQIIFGGAAGNAGASVLSSI